MMRAVITEPLLTNLKEDEAATYSIIIALNEQYPDGIQEAHRVVMAMLDNLKLTPKPVGEHPNYIFAKLSGTQILELAAKYREYAAQDQARWNSPVYRVWEDPEIRACLTKSLVTVKADAAQRAFNAFGDGITWAVLDSGIDRKHPHFKDVVDPNDKMSRDFVLDDPFKDDYGHGTHVAGIISGSFTPPAKKNVVAVESMIEGSEGSEVQLEVLDSICGVAPRTKLVSMKVLDQGGVGKTSAALLAIQRIQELNQNGRRLRIHGVNMSIGYDFNPRWFGCGQSPLCVEVDRLVKSGVVVVVAAGNSGYINIAFVF